MNCSHVEAHASDYLAGRLEELTRSEFESHLAACATCREMMQASRQIWRQLGALPEVKPGPALRFRVDALIEAYRQGMQASDGPAVPSEHWWDRLLVWRNPHPAFQLALAALVFAAGLLARPLFTQEKSSALAFAQFQEEVRSLRQWAALTLLQQPSASERLEGVSRSLSVASQDEKVLSALLQALESDPNVNVRVAAVDALRQLAGRATVKNGLLRSLAKEDAPLVQIELIDLMVQLREKASIPVLKQICQNPDYNLAVRQRAEWGLQQLI